MDKDPSNERLTKEEGAGGGSGAGGEEMEGGAATDAVWASGVAS
jgi:hypothetical protein